MWHHSLSSFETETPIRPAPNPPIDLDFPSNSDLVPGRRLFRPIQGYITTVMGRHGGRWFVSRVVRGCQGVGEVFRDRWGRGWSRTSEPRTARCLDTVIDAGVVAPPPLCLTRLQHHTTLSRAERAQERHNTTILPKRAKNQFIDINPAFHHVVHLVSSFAQHCSTNTHS